MLEAIIGRRPDGIFLTGIMLSQKGRTRLLASGIPVVETWDLTPTPIDMLVGFSHADIGREVAQYLIKKGRKRFALVARRRRARRAPCPGFPGRAGAPQAGAGAGGQRGGLALAGQRARALGQMLAQLPQVDAVFCSSDLLALGVMTEARRARHGGARAPVHRRLWRHAAGGRRAAALTTVRINGADIGHKAAQYLIARRPKAMRCNSASWTWLCHRGAGQCVMRVVHGCLPFNGYNLVPLPCYDARLT